MAPIIRQTTLRLKRSAGAVEANIAEIGKCFAASNWQGKVKINLTINSNGTVKKVEVIASGIDAKIKKCVSEQVKKWLFLATASGQVVKVTIVLTI